MIARALLAIEGNGAHRAGQKAKFVALLFDSDDKPCSGFVPMFLVDGRPEPVAPPIPPTNAEYGSTTFWFSVKKGTHYYKVAFSNVDASEIVRSNEIEIEGA